MISKDGIKEILFDSGSACTYKNRMQNGVGIEMASVIPGFAQKYDIDVVAIGNGTASRESEKLVAEVISEYKENTQDGEIDMVSYTLILSMANDTTIDGLGDYTTSIESQERYYTNSGYTCSVNKY